jgi:biopolymer transport protein ExbB/TolQ
MNEIENVIFDIAEALRAPVLILALVALAVSLIELGAFIVELVRRRRRDYNRLETAAVEARDALNRGDEVGAKAALRPVAWSTGMARALAFMVEQWGKSGVGDRLAKGLADFDFRSLRRLERTRLLVRAGPALGLMGTLIPLAPALEGLADGDTQELSDNLRVAFSVTVLGLLIGAIAFGISLVRDRLYGQDLSDLEFVAATLAPDSDLGSGGAGVRPPRPAGAAAAPPPAAAAAVANKPPPPKDAKPLGSELPPPGGAPAAPSPTPAASGDAAGTPPAPMPTGGQSTAASPPGAGAGNSQPGPTAPPVPGAEAPAAPPVPSAPPAPAAPPAEAAPPGPTAPPVPGSESPAAPPAPEAPPPPPPPAPMAAPAPPPPPAPEAPAADPPTQQLPPTAPGDRPTQATNPQPGDGQGTPDPAPENR